MCPIYLASHFATRTFGDIQEVDKFLVSLSLESLGYIVANRTCCRTDLLNKAGIVFEFSFTSNLINLICKFTRFLINCQFLKVLNSHNLSNFSNNSNFSLLFRKGLKIFLMKMIIFLLEKYVSE